MNRLFDRNIFLYLWSRQLVNSLRRTTTSIRRLLSVVFIVGYFVFILISVIGEFGMTAAGPTGLITPALARTIVFWVFSFLWILGLVAITQGNGATQLAEIEVLFPTPVSQAQVLRFKLGRTIAASVILPILFRTAYAVEGLYHPSPLHLNGVSLSVVIDLGLAAFLLNSVISGVWSFVYMLSFRKDTPTAEKRGSVALYSIGTLSLAAILFSAFLATRHGAVPGLTLAASNPIVQVIFFPATFATWLTMGPVMGWPLAVLGLAAIIGLIGLGVWLAFRQLDWFYDIASTRTSAVATRLQAMKTGNAAAVVQDMAKRGKFKARGRGFLSNIRVQGPMSFVWREIALFIRQQQALAFIFLAIAIGYTALPFFLFPPTGKDAVSSVVMVLVFQSGGISYASMLTMKTGVTYFLQQSDLLKPLCFTSKKIIFMELMSKGWLGFTIVPVVSLIMILAEPGYLPFAVPILFYTPTFSFIFAGSQFMGYMALPDINDLGQRTLRGLLSFAALAICALPSVGAAALAWYLAGPTAAGLIGAGINVGMTALIVHVSAKLYENYVVGE